MTETACAHTLSAEEYIAQMIAPLSEARSATEIDAAIELLERTLDGQASDRVQPVRQAALLVLEDLSAAGIVTATTHNLFSFAGEVFRLPEWPAGLCTLRDLENQPELLAPPEAVVPLSVWRGRVTLLASREKEGKSTLAAAAAAEVSRNGLWLGQRVPTGRVLWVGVEEAPGDVGRRLLEFGANPDNVYIFGEPGGDLLRAAIECCRPVLVVVDTLATWALSEGLEPSDASGWTRVMRVFVESAHADGGPGFLILHHSRKSDGAYRDSTAIGAAADVILTMTPGPTNCVRKLAAKGRLKVGDYSIEFDPEALTYRQIEGQPSLDAQVLAWVRENPGCSKNAVRKGVKAKASDVDDALKRNIDQGEVEDRGVKGKAQLHVTGVAI